MNNKVKFLRGTSDEYAVAVKDNDTIYFTTDDGKLYIGDKEISGSDITIDDTLSDTSTNPVQNKAVKAELDKKADITDIPTSLPANGGNADTVNGHSVNADVPENAKFTDTVYTHPTTSGNKHIPAGGSSGQILRWSADGTAVWGSDNNTDTKVTSPSNHYTPAKSTTKSASGGTLTDIANSTLGTQVVTGVEMDAKGHVTGVVSTALKTSVPVVVSLTRNEYDALSTKDPNTYYMITDDVGDTSDAVVLNVGKDK